VFAHIFGTMSNFTMMQATSVRNCKIQNLQSRLTYDRFTVRYIDGHIFMDHPVHRLAIQ